MSKGELAAAGVKVTSLQSQVEQTRSALTVKEAQLLQLTVGELCFVSGTPPPPVFYILLQARDPERECCSFTVLYSYVIIVSHCTLSFQTV